MSFPNTIEADDEPVARVEQRTRQDESGIVRAWAQIR